MKIAATHSHQNGWEFIQVHHKKRWNEIVDAICAVDASKCKVKVSKEKRTAGSLFYSPIEMNKRMRANFGARDWTEKRTSYWVTEDAKLIERTIRLPPKDQKAEILRAGRTPIFSYNQTDMVKDRIAVEIQFGKYSFVAYDLFVKHMAFFTSAI